MTATFLVTLNIDDASVTSLTSEAEDIHDTLASAGHDVEEVKPWARPSLQQTPAIGQPPDLMQQPPSVLPPPNPFA